MNDIREPPDGAPLDRPLCEFVPESDVNNDESREVTLLPSGTFATESCANDLLGPLRNCSFSAQLEGIEVLVSDESSGDTAGDDLPEDETDSDRNELIDPEGAFACEPGRPVTLTCSVENDRAPQILRLCEFSAALGTGVGCTFLDSLANEIIGQEPVEFNFTCPFQRDEQEPGGLFALYTAPVLGEDERQPISCQAGQ